MKVDVYDLIWIKKEHLNILLLLLFSLTKKDLLKKYQKRFLDDLVKNK
jgi:hypothetical protein